MILSFHDLAVVGQRWSGFPAGARLLGAPNPFQEARSGERQRSQVADLEQAVPMRRGVLLRGELDSTDNIGNTCFQEERKKRLPEWRF